MSPSMSSSPALIRSSETSWRRTSMPASAQTWAMPVPICPAPMMPMVLISVRHRIAPRQFQRRAVGSQRPALASSCSSSGRSGEEVADQAVVGDLEDRRLLVLVDRHDHLRVLHAGQMLDRPRDPHRNVQLRRHHLAGLPHLPVVRRIARVHRRPRRPDRRPEPVGDRLDHPPERLRRAERTPPRDDDPRRGQLRPVALRDLLAPERRARRRPPRSPARPRPEPPRRPRPSAGTPPCAP